MSRSDHFDPIAGDSDFSEDLLDFAAGLCGSERRHVVFITPDGAIQCKTYSEAQTDELLREIIRRNARQNVYIHVNPLIDSVANSKATKKMVRQAKFAYVDIDDPNGLDRLLKFPIPPTAIVASGGGFNAYWRLQEPLQVAEDVEDINRWVCEQLSGDPAATDCCRILRYPGTINHPTRVKRERGRHETRSYLIRDQTDWSRTYPSEVFGRISGGPHVNERSSKGRGSSIYLRDLPEGVGEHVATVARFGDDPARPRGSASGRYRSRSEAVYAVACGLARQGRDAEAIAGVLINPALKISESLLGRRDPDKEALRQAHKAIARVGQDWPDGRQKGNNNPNRTLQNTQLAIMRLDLACSFDVFANSFRVRGSGEINLPGDELSERGTLGIRDAINKKFHFDPGTELTRDSIVALCNANEYDPVCDYLAGLVWDKVPRIEKFLTHVAGAEDTPYVRTVSRIMFISAVRRARSPGTKYDTTIILEGVQGSGKSTLLRILAGDEFYSDQDVLALDAKAQMEIMEGVWILELSELSGLTKAETNKLKAFLSRSVDKARPAYGRVAERRARRGVLIGTTNDEHYLRDLTGNRRFLPVACRNIDVEMVRELRDQLWAEAAAREDAGESIVLPADLWNDAAIEQGKRVAPDAWEDILAGVTGELFNGRQIVSTWSLFYEVLRMPPGKYNIVVTKRLARLMNSLGWKGPSTLTFRGGLKAKGYWRPEPGPRQARFGDV